MPGAGCPAQCAAFAFRASVFFSRSSRAAFTVSSVYGSFARAAFSSSIAFVISAWAAFARSTHGPTAVVCVNDQIAFTVLRALAQRRVRVPRDISVVGYDDVEFAAMLTPALTSIRQPKYEVGRAAAELLLAETLDPNHRHGDIRFEPELIERQSTTARSRLNRYSPAGD